VKAGRTAHVAPSSPPPAAVGGGLRCQCQCPLRRRPVHLRGLCTERLLAV